MAGRLLEQGSPALLKGRHSAQRRFPAQALGNRIWNRGLRRSSHRQGLQPYGGVAVGADGVPESGAGAASLLRAECLEILPLASDCWVLRS